MDVPWERHYLASPYSLPPTTLEIPFNMSLTDTSASCLYLDQSF